MSVNVALYMRYSSAAQNDGYSIEAQQKALRRYCRDKNYTIVEEYIDRACTGTNANREEFQRMIEDSKLYKFEIILVHKTDRFSRNRYDAIMYKAMLKQRNVKLISITENFGEGVEADLMEGIAEAFAEYYSKNLGREVKKGLDIVASKCLHTGGSAPLGYYVGEDRKLHINEEEATIVRKIFDMYSCGYTYNDIAKELNLRGYKTKAGNDFSAASMNSILQNKKYSGVYIYNRRAGKNYDGSFNSHKEKPTEEMTIIPDGVPRIVDQKTFDLVQQRLLSNKDRTKKYKPDSHYLLSGLIYCGKCGYHYQGNSRKSGTKKNSVYSSYRCGKKQNNKGGCSNGEIEKNRLENFVLEQLQQLLCTDESIQIITELVNQYNTEVKQVKNVDLIRYEKELKSVTKQIENLTNAIALGAAEEAIIAKINVLMDTKKELEERIATCSLKELPPIKSETVKNALLELKRYIKENNTVEVKNFLKSFVEKVVINEDSVEVIYKLSANQLGSTASEEGTGAVFANVEISKEDIMKYPKQKRKIVPKSNEAVHIKKYSIDA